MGNPRALQKAIHQHRGLKPLIKSTAGVSSQTGAMGRTGFGASHSVLKPHFHLASDAKILEVAAGTDPGLAQLFGSLDGLRHPQNSLIAVTKSQGSL